MEVLGEHIQPAMKEMWDAKWEDPADLKARGYEATETEPDTSRVPLSNLTKHAIPGDNTCAWQESHTYIQTIMFRMREAVD